MSNDVELVFRFQVAGKAALDSMAASAKALTAELRNGNQVVGQLERSLANTNEKLKTVADRAASVRQEMASLRSSIRSVADEMDRALSRLNAFADAFRGTAGRGGGGAGFPRGASPASGSGGAVTIWSGPPSGSGGSYSPPSFNQQRLLGPGPSRASSRVIDAQFENLGTVAAGLDKVAAANVTVQESMTASILKAGALGIAFTALFKVTQEYTLGAAEMAARTQTLGVVMDNLAKQNNLSVESTRVQADATRKLGITRQDSLSVINKLIVAQIDLKRSTELARMAQDAAVISGQNSSDALAGIVHGITTRQPEILRTYGIVVDFEREYTRVAHERKTVLSAQEKQEIALQLVLAQSTKIAGSYEAAMLTTGKQMTSLTRYVDDAKNAIGDGLVPVLGKAVFMMTDLAKWTEQNSDRFSALATGAGAAGLALLGLNVISNFTPVGRGVKAGVTAAAFLTGYAGAPTEYDNFKENGQRTVESLIRSRESINQRLGAVGSGAEADQLKREFDLTTVSLQRVRESLLVRAGELFAKAPGDDLNKYALDFGGGIKLSGMEVAAQASRVGYTDPNGATFNQKGFDEAQARERARVILEQSGKLGNEVREYLEKLEQGSVDPLLRFYVDANQKLDEWKRKFPNVGLSANQQSEFVFDLRDRIQQYQKGQNKQHPLSMVPSDMTTQNYQYSLQLAQNRTDAIAQTPISMDPARGEKMLADMRAKSVESMQRYTGYQEQMLRLLLGPAGELTAIDRIAALRENTAKRVFDTSKKDYEARLVYEDRLNQISMDRELQLATMRQKRDQENHETAGKVFDALLTRSTTGASDLVKGAFTGQGRQLFSNASAGIVGSAGKFLGGLIPGQQDADGNPTAIGRLFAGTVFDKQNTELGKNTSEMTKLRGSILTLNRTIGSVSIGGGTVGGGTAGLSALLPASSLNLLDGITGVDMNGLVSKAASVPGSSWLSGKAGALKAPLAQFGAGAGSLLRAGLYSGFKSEDFSMLGPDGRVTTRSDLKLDSTAARVGNVAGSTAAITAGALTAYSGFKEGGFAGNTQGVAATLGTAALIPGPQQPFIAAAAATAALVGMLIPDPKKKRAAQLQADLEASRRDDPVGRSYEFDRSGRQVSYDYTGQMRTTSVTQILQISALDGPSVQQVLHNNRGAIADSLSSAISDGLSGRLMDNMRTAQGG